MPTDHKARILQAAGELFASAAFHEVTTQQIHRRAGLGNGSLFHVFPTKRAVAVELYAEACRHRDRRVTAALTAQPNDAAKVIKAAVQELVRFMASTERHAVLLRRLRAAIDDGPRLGSDPDSMTALVVVLEAWLKQPVIARQVVALPPALIAILLLSPARALAQLAMDDQAAVTKEMIEQLAGQVWAGLRAEPPVRQRIPRKKVMRSLTAKEDDLFRDVR